MTPNLTYDPATHTYRLAGKRIPGITTVLSALSYYKGQDFYTQKASNRGSSVHLVCFLADEHAPDAKTAEDALNVLGRFVDIGPALLPYLEGYLLFKKEHNFRPERHEFQVCSTRLNIAATPDLYGTLHHVPTVVEIKTWAQAPPKVQRSAEIQTAAQSMMITEHLQLPVEERLVVALTGDVNLPYRVYSCHNQTDKAVVLACSSVFWDRVSAGLLDWSTDVAEMEAP